MVVGTTAHKVLAVHHAQRAGRVFQIRVVGNAAIDDGDSNPTAIPPLRPCDWGVYCGGGGVKIRLHRAVRADVGHVGVAGQLAQPVLRHFAGNRLDKGKVALD